MDVTPPAESATPEPSMPAVPTLTGPRADFGQPGDTMTVMFSKVSSTSYIDLAMNGQEPPPGAVWDQSQGRWAAENGTKFPMTRLNLDADTVAYQFVGQPPGVLPGEIVLGYFFHSRLGCLGPLDPGIAPAPRAAYVTLRI
jgi:hypothetical protein